MAAELVNTTAWQNFMKVRGIFPAMTEVYRIKSVLLQNLEGRGGRFDPGGRTMEIPFETDPNPSYGNIGENEMFPEPSSPTAVIGYASMKTAAARFRITERAVLASQGNEKAWASAKMHNMANLVAMFAQFQNRELLCQWGPAAYGRVSAVNAGSIELFADQEAGGGYTKGGGAVIKGQRFSNHTGALTDANPDGTSDIQITGKTTAANGRATLTYQGQIGDMAVNDYLMLGSRERPSMNRAMIGIFGCLDGTLVPNYLGLARSSYPFLNGKIENNVGGADLDKKIQTKLDELWLETEAEIDMILTTVGVRRAYFDQHVPELRYVSAAETGKFKGNFSFLAFQSPTNNNKVLPIDIERDMPAGTVLGLNFSTFYFGELKAPSWFPSHMEGSDFWHNVPEYAAWDAIFRTHREFICKAPLMNFMLRGVTEA